MIRYVLQIPAVVAREDHGLVDVQFRKDIKITMTKETFSRVFKVLKEESTLDV